VSAVYKQAAMLLKVVLRFVPIKEKEAIAATAINAAINAYSIAVTPDVSLTSFGKSVCNWAISCSACVEYTRRLQLKL
jgi:hypothetical protein